MAYDLGFPLIGGACQVACHGWKHTLTTAEYFHLVDHHLASSLELCEDDLRSFYAYATANGLFVTSNYLATSVGYSQSNPLISSTGIPGQVLGGSFGTTTIVRDASGNTFTDPAPPVAPPVVPPVVGSVVVDETSWVSVDATFVQNYEITDLKVVGYRLDFTDTTPIIVTAYNTAGDIVGFDDSYTLGSTIDVTLDVTFDWSYLTDLKEKDIRGICVAKDGSGDVFVFVYNEGIYKQTAGAGNFALTQAFISTAALSIAPNGDKFLFHDTDLYKAASGSDTFVDTGVPLPGVMIAGDIQDIAFDSSGDLFFTVASGGPTEGVYKITTPSGTPSTAALYLTQNNCYGIAINSSDDIYISFVHTDSFCYVAIQTAAVGSFVSMSTQFAQYISAMEFNPVDDELSLIHSLQIYYTLEAGTTTFVEGNSPYRASPIFQLYANDSLGFTAAGTLYWASSFYKDGVAYLPMAGVLDFSHCVFSGGAFEFVGFEFSDASAAVPRGIRAFSKRCDSTTASDEAALVQTHILEVL